jgi:superfamily II DNA/RNA helicase
LDQSQRTRTLDGFRAGTLRFLIASDVAARGLDVPAVSHVFNFDVPSHAEDYVHRIGRTGRAGRSGKALMICNPRDEKNLAGVEALIQKEIPRVESPVTFTPPTTETEPPQGSEERPAKPRRARNVSRGKPEERPAASHKAPETVSEQAVEATPPQERPQERRPERTPEPRQDRNRDRNDDNAPRHREGRGRQDHGGGPRVMGLGDHLPSFIALSFDERRTG